MTESTAWRWRALAAGLLVVILAGAVTLYQALVLPGQLGFTRDDGMYALYAKALATGQGFVDLSVPGHPTAARYPIGFPALLALALQGAEGLAAQVARLQAVPPWLGAAFVAASYFYWRDRVGWSVPVALAAAAVVAFHPVVVGQASLVMADLAFGTIALVALVLAERALERPTLRAWAVVGLVVALACLTRYFALTLVAAVVLVLLHRRAWPSLGAFSAGLVPPLAAWLLYRGMQGGETYTQEVSAEFTRQLAQAGASASAAFRAVVHQGLPELVGPGLSGAPAPVAITVGILAALALALTLPGWIRRPPRGTSAIAPLYLALTVLLAAAMEFGYPGLRGILFTRYVLPVLPLGLVAFSLLAPPASRRWAGGVALAVVLIASAVADRGLLERQRAMLAHTDRLADYTHLHDYLRTLPPGTRLMGWHGHALTFYTGHPALTFPSELRVEGVATPPALLHRTLVAAGTTHVVGTPQIEDGEDASVRTLNGFSQAYPGLLEPVYVNATGNFVVFAVTRP